MAESGKSDIDEIVNAFLTDIESIRTSATITGLMVMGLSQFIAKRLNEFLYTCERVEGAENSYKIPPEKFYKHKKLEEDYRRGARANEIVPRSLLVALVSQYDAFLSALVRALFIHQPALIRSSNRMIEFSEVLKFSSIDEAKNAVMDAELESLLRDSHHEQFAWLENRFELRTLREFPAWKNFVELTQRRNLFVHTDGKVSKQYLKVCQENGVELKGIKLGDQLEADSSYVRKSADTLLEVAVKLSQVLWRKTLPSQIEEADKSLVSITYDLLERKRYGLAIILLDFAFDVVKKYSCTDVRLRLLINRANAYRLSGNLPRCAELVGGEDWQAYDPSFRLAAHILRNDNDEAFACMKQIGTSGKISMTDYREWPIFEGIRKDQEFMNTFADIFGEPFIAEEIVTSQEGQEAATKALSNFSLDDISNADFSIAIPTSKPN